MDTGGMENMFQLQFTELIFQVFGLFLNIIISLMQVVLTDVFGGIFNAVAGGSTM